MNESMLTIDEAAGRLGTTPLNVLMHVKRGLLEGVELDGTWLIERGSLDRLKATTGGGRAHGVCASACAGKTACGGGCG